MFAVAVGICVFLACVVGYLVLLIKRYIVQKIGQEKYDHINRIIEDCVRYIEQMGKNIGWSGEDKKFLAVNLCTEMIKKLGYEVDKDLVEKLIERAVQIINESTIEFQLDEPGQAD
jgi:hypothetical protein